MLLYEPPLLLKNSSYRWALLRQPLSPKSSLGATDIAEEAAKGTVLLRQATTPATEAAMPTQYRLHNRSQQGVPREVRSYNRQTIQLKGPQCKKTQKTEYATLASAAEGALLQQGRSFADKAVMRAEYTIQDTSQ